jgi:hypothetical protein
MFELIDGNGNVKAQYLSNLQEAILEGIELIQYVKGKNNSLWIRKYEKTLMIVRIDKEGVYFSTLHKFDHKDFLPE